MINFLHGEDLCLNAHLATTMLTDRAKQFSDRLGWPVSVNEKGEELDEYDTLNPLYVIAAKPDGSHAGSMRFLPTLGRTMVNEHFAHLINGSQIRSPLIWECTRFCISPGADRTTAPKLMAAAGKIMKEYEIKHYIGVFDRRMERVYQWIGSSPTVLGRTRIGSASAGIGLWDFDEILYQELLTKAGISNIEMELWFSNSPCLKPTLKRAG